MPGVWTDAYSFVTGAVRHPGLSVLALVKDATNEKMIDHTFFFEWDRGEWVGSETALPWGVVRMTVCTDPIEQVLALGEDGQVWCCGSGDVHEEIIRTTNSDPRRRGPLRGIRAIAGRAYAVGMDRQAYRRDGASMWAAVDDGARPGSGQVVGFEAVDGFAENEIYAVGWDGEIWVYNGAIWSEVNSPTNLVLSDVCCAGDGVVYACCRRGGLLRGRGQYWEMPVSDSTIGDIWNLAWYKDELYFSTIRWVYRLNGDEAVPVDFGSESPTTCFHLSARDGVLWSIGAKDVLAFDGNTWSRID
jgi:hypothetical protein